MKRTLLLFLVSVAAANCSAVLMDLNAPVWRGDEGTTYQEWEFLTDANPTEPDVYVNDYGIPSLKVCGENSIWLQEDYGHVGVWSVYGDSMKACIPNLKVENPYKEILLQIVYKEDLLIWTDPKQTSVTLIDEQVQPDGYTYAAYSIIIEPNPFCEKIIIRPYLCGTFIDSLIIDTICVPEPASLSILALGGLFLLKRKK